MSFTTLRQQDLSWTKFPGVVSRPVPGVPMYNATLQANIVSDASRSTDTDISASFNDDTRSRYSEVTDEVDRKEEVSKFIDAYRSTNFRDVPVTKMRHVISLLLMEVYSDQYGMYARKVKGIWKQKPQHWPDNVPYVDPNNKLKMDDGSQGSKPKKQLLVPMLMHLVTRYMERTNGVNTVDGSSLTGGIVPYLSAVAEVTASPVEQVQEWIDTEPADPPMDWDPVAETKSRIGSKIAFIKQSGLINAGPHLEVLCNAFTALRQASSSGVVGVHNWLAFAHKLELALDKLKITGITALDVGLMIELQSFPVGLQDIKPVPAADDMLMLKLNITRRGGPPCGGDAMSAIIDKRPQASPTTTSPHGGATDAMYKLGIEWNVAQLSNHSSAIVTSATGRVDDVVSSLNIQKKNASSGVDTNDLLADLVLELRQEGMQMEDDGTEDEDFKKLATDLGWIAEYGFDLLPDLGSNVLDEDAAVANFTVDRIDNVNGGVRTDTVAAAAVATVPDSETSSALVTGFQPFDEPFSPEVLMVGDGSTVVPSFGMQSGPVGMMAAAAVTAPSSRMSTPSFDFSTCGASSTAVYTPPHGSLAGPISPAFQSIAGNMQKLTLSQNGSREMIWSPMLSAGNASMNGFQQHQLHLGNMPFKLLPVPPSSNGSPPPRSFPLHGKRSAPTQIPKFVEEMDSDDNDVDNKTNEPLVKKSYYSVN